MNAPLALVTGAPGWLGTRLVETLVRGLPDVPALATPPARPVRCLVLRGTSGAARSELPTGVEVVEGDVRDPASLRDFARGAEGATVFHLAGLITPRRARDVYDVNVEGTRHLLDAAVAAGARRLIAISSNTVAGWNRRPEEVFDEESPPHPHLHYGRSKHQMEEMLRAAAARSGTDVVILRPCRFYGPGQPRARTRFYALIRDGHLPMFDGGGARWSMSYLDNTCQALLLAERSAGAGGQTYWIADRRPYALREIVDTVERLLELEFGIAVRHRRLRLPAVIARAGAFADATLQRAGIFDQRLHALAHLNATMACSIAKAERELGYAPSVELEEGLRRSIRWCIERGHGI